MFLFLTFKTYELVFEGQAMLILLVIHYCVKHSGLKQTCFFSKFLGIRNLESALWHVSDGVSHEVILKLLFLFFVIKFLAGPASAEVLPRAGGCIFKKAHSRGCGLEVSVSCPVGLTTV